MPNSNRSQNSRLLSIGASETIQKAIFSNEKNRFWRLVVVSKSDIVLKITVTVRQEETEREISFRCAPKSAVDFNSWGWCKVKIENETATAGTFQISLESPIEDTQQQIESATVTYSDAIFYNVDPNGGYAPPFCNYVSIYASDSFRARFVDHDGNTVWQTGTISATNQHILNELRVPKDCRLQIRSNSIGTSVTFKIVWFKKV